MKKSSKILRRILIGVFVVIVLCFSGFYIYTLNYYKANNTVSNTLNSSNVNAVSENDLMLFYPPYDMPYDTALIFYPGGKVDYTAYAPLLSQLANKGIACVLVKMPFNLAVFDVDAADKAFSLLPKVNKWFISGHSLGGAMASNYASKHTEDLNGVILLGSYPVAPSEIPTLTVYGSEDMIVNREKLNASKDTIEIKGGNHAYFGNYGEQKGDGMATITPKEQQAETVQAIIDFIRGLN